MTKPEGANIKFLIAGYLERISSKVFDEYHDKIASLVTKQHGVQFTAM
jgi:hypothetical protein